MSKNESSFHQLKPHLRSQKNLIFKGKKYVIDFDEFKKYSNFFYTRRKEYKLIDDIDLSDEEIEINDDSFQNFINCCLNRKFEINKSNIFALHQLAHHYDVPVLIQVIQEYILNHPDLSIQASLLNLVQNKENSKQEDEKNVSNHFLQIIQNDKFLSYALSLQISVLYRILNNYDLILNETNQNQILNFLLKYLRKHGSKASVLFSNIDIKNSSIDLLSRLLNDYSDVFDFSMLNSKNLVKTTSKLLSEINALKIDFSVKLDQMNQSFEKQQNENRNLISQISKLTELIECQNGQQNELKIKLNEYETKLLQQNKKISELENQISQQNLKIDATNLKVDSKKGANSKKEQIQGIDFKYSGKNFSGIINYLKSESQGNIENMIIFTASSMESDNYHPRNSILYDDSNLFDYFASRNLPNSWFCLDFKDHRVIMTDYTVGSTYNNYHPKSWVIEGSNDNNTWNQIDLQSNCPYTNGSKIVHTFSIQNKNNDAFKYIRMRQTGPCWNGNNDYFRVNSFEIYGTLI